MKNLSFIILFISLAIGSCVKDRVKPASTGPVTVGDRKLIHYWSFSVTDTPAILLPDTTIGGAAISWAAAYYDGVTPGTLLNGRSGLNTDTASGLRMRNPFTSITFKMPTTGFKQPILTFATQRSNSGPSGNTVMYTTDGTNYTSTGLAATSFTIGTTWSLVSIDFSGISAVDDNPNFAVKFSTTDNNTGTSGNDRYDNVTLDAFAK